MAKTEKFIGPDGTEWDILPSDTAPDGDIDEHGQVHCRKCGGLWFKAEIVLSEDWDTLAIFSHSPERDVIHCKDCGEPLRQRGLRDFKVV